MDGVQLRDEAAQDRIRAAVEFLDPSKCYLTSLKKKKKKKVVGINSFRSFTGEARARRFVNTLAELITSN